MTLRSMFFSLFLSLAGISLSAQYGDCPTEGSNTVYLNHFSEAENWFLDEWIIYELDTMVYNEAQLVESRTTRLWDSDFEQFVNSSRSFNDYDVNNKRVTWRYQLWNGALWYDFLHTVSIYNAESQLILERDSVYNNTLGELVNTRLKSDYVYDEDGNLSGYISSELNEEGEMEPVYKFEFSNYTEAGIHSNSSTFLYEDGSWTDYRRTERIFNSFGQLSNVRTYAYVLGEEQISQDNIYFYLDDGNLNYIVYQSYGNGEVTQITRVEYLHDTCDNLVYKTDKYLDFATGEYINIARRHNFYVGQDAYVSNETLVGPELQFFPNPAADQMTIQGLQAYTPIEYRIYSIQGQLLEQAELAPLMGAAKINTQHLSSGSYLIQLQVERELYSRVISVR